jgi:hypothetical protein
MWLVQLCSAEQEPPAAGSNNEKITLGLVVVALTSDMPFVVQVPRD